MRNALLTEGRMKRQVEEDEVNCTWTIQVGMWDVYCKYFPHSSSTFCRKSAFFFFRKALINSGWFLNLWFLNQKNISEISPSALFLFLLSQKRMAMCRHVSGNMFWIIPKPPADWEELVPSRHLPQPVSALHSGLRGRLHRGWSFSWNNWKVIGP